jgi:hypothetical protein
MDEKLTLAEIKERFDGEWVLLDDPDVNEHQQVIAGRVVSHSKDRDEVYQRAVELRLRHSATLYLGSMPANTAIAI